MTTAHNILIRGVEYSEYKMPNDRDRTGKLFHCIQYPEGLTSRGITAAGLSKQGWVETGKGFLTSGGEREARAEAARGIGKALERVSDAAQDKRRRRACAQVSLRKGRSTASRSRRETVSWWAAGAHGKRAVAHGPISLETSRTSDPALHPHGPEQEDHSKRAAAAQRGRG